MPASSSQRIWTQIILPYLQNSAVLICPSARNAGLPTNWVHRGIGSIGYATTTAFDPQEQEGFAKLCRLAEMEDPTRTPLFADTASGSTAEKYRGYVFDPHNGGNNSFDARLGTPLVADRDLVQEMSSLPPA